MGSSELKFILVRTPDQITSLANLAEEIWTEYFPAITGIDKAKYLLNQMLSIDALLHCIADEGYEYYFVELNKKRIGFLGIVPLKDENKLQFSKIYLIKEYRGKGFGKQMLAYGYKRAFELGFNSVILNVNCENKPAIAFYEHMDLRIVDTVEIDVGNGYSVVDYIFEKDIT